MNQLYTIGLLIASNTFMTVAWYGHLKYQQIHTTSHAPLVLVILCSWLLALPEYACQVPANRIGFAGNGGPYTLVQLKVIQEAISLTVFTLFLTFFFGNGTPTLHWNHLAAFACLLVAVYLVFME